MRPLSLDDLLPLEEFTRQRGELFRAHQRYLDRYRRVRVGPEMTVLFENRQTLWFRVQEVLRIARLTDPHRVRAELDWYNQLLPERGCWQAALLLGSGWTDPCDAGVLRLQAGEAVVIGQLVTNRPEDLSIGMAHWIEFTPDAALIQTLADWRCPAYVEAHFGAYHHVSLPFSDDLRQSLLDDLRLT